MRSLSRAVAGALVSGSLLLAGCGAIPGFNGSSGTPSARVSAPATRDASTGSGTSDQSVTAACEALGATMESASNTLDTAMKDLGSDPQGALKALQSFTTTLRDAVAKVDNPTVKAQGDKSVAALNDLVTALGEGIKDPTKLAGLPEKLNAVQTELTAIGTVCGG